MALRELREKINLYIYNSKAKNLRRLKVISIFISLLAIGSLFCYHGLYLDKSTSALLLFLVEFSFAFYVFHYLAKIFYDFDPREFVRKHWFQGIMVAILVMEGVSYNLFDVLIIAGIFNALGLENIGALSVVFFQLYLFIVAFFELSDNTSLITNIRLNPTAIFIFSFLIIIAVGTALLMMPQMTVKGSVSFIDALFTAVSATCVTGLSVVDTGTTFTFKGLIVLMVLMKVGGLNIVAFAYLAAFLNRFGFGLKQDESIEDFTTKDAFYNAKDILLKVFAVSIIIELAGAFLIYLLITPEMPLGEVKDKLFFGMFHSIAAFNNAGFSTLPHGMYTEFVREAYLMHLAMAALIFLGSFGFTNLFDLYTPANLRARLKYPWKRPGVATRIAVYTHVGLIVIGTIGFFIIEAENTLAGKNFIEAGITSLFQSVVTRTAGFNSVDITVLTAPVILMFIFLMFIGGNTYSTAGGIKTSTFAVIVLNMYSVIRGKKDTELWGRTIAKEDVLRAFSIFFSFLGGMVIAVFLLSIIEADLLARPDRELIHFIFEEVSAFATVGLSLGITSELSSAGKLVVIASMFMGRVGTLSIIFVFARKTMSTNYTYPEEHIMVG